MSKYVENHGIINESVMNSTQFKIGQIPWNKGKKVPTNDIHAKNIIGGIFGRWTVIEFIGRKI